MRANQLFAVLLGVAATLLASQPLARAGGADGPAGLGPLAAKALVDAHRSTGLAVPDDPPPVLLIPTDALAGLVCAGRCRGVGAYLPGQGILLDRELDPAGNVRGRALLLHELVLYALERGQADPELAPCARYQRWERRAYAAQHAYLEAAGLSLVTLVSPQRWLAGCGSPPVVDRLALRLAGAAGPAEVASR